MASSEFSDGKMEPTSSMELWDGTPVPRPHLGQAGLVLLCAEDQAAVPSSFPLDRSLVLIGRDAEAANLVIPQRSVSRVHAAVQVTSTGFLVRDLGSRNGVIVSGRVVHEGALGDGEELRVGDAVYKLVARGAPAYAPYRLDGAVAAGARRTTIPGAVGGLLMATISSEVELVAPGDLPVLVLGETGTGKELVARALHSMSGRRGALQAVNCASIPAPLVESELFGHVRGAFTSAARDHVGRIRAAEGGTLFLDEIGDMPLEAQAKLLRVLETKEVVPVGAVSGQHVDVRVVSATHRNLRELVSSGRFRADLHARLDGYTVRLPPLRSRKEDLFMLVRYFLAANGAPDRPVSFGFMVALCHYEWPYNVRELAAAVKRAVTISNGARLEPAHLPEPIIEAMRSYGLAAAAVAEAPERATPVVPDASPKQARAPRPAPADLLALLERHEGNVSAVARALGKDRALVNRWIRADGVDPEAYRRA